MILLHLQMSHVPACYLCVYWKFKCWVVAWKVSSFKRKVHRAPFSTFLESGPSRHTIHIYEIMWIYHHLKATLTTSSFTWWIMNPPLLLECTAQSCSNICHLTPTTKILIFPQRDAPQDPSWSCFEEAVNSSASAPVEREVEISIWHTVWRSQRFPDRKHQYVCTFLMGIMCIFCLREMIYVNRRQEIIRPKYRWCTKTVNE